MFSTDKDGDFSRTGEKISRNRIIVEFGELDGAWILRDIPESSKIKKFNHIFTPFPNNILLKNNTLYYNLELLDKIFYNNNGFVQNI